MFETARVLTVPVAYFFEGYNEALRDGDIGKSSPELNVSSFLNTDEGVALAELFPRVRSSKQRRTILELVRALVEEA